MSSSHQLRVRWLGRVPYREALAVQTALFDHGDQQHLLLVEHPHVFTHGRRADLATNLRVEPAAVDAELVAIDRGGDVTYHGPGQLVGYPIVTLDNSLGAAGHVGAIQQLIIDTLGALGVADVGTLAEYPGVWVGVTGPTPRKICAIGVRIARNRARVPRTMHGFALNIDTDMRYLREHIVPCGIADRPVTSLREEGCTATMDEVVELVAARAAEVWGAGELERQDIAWRHRPDDLSAFSRGAGPGQVVRVADDHAAAVVGPVAGTPSMARAASRLQAAGVSDGLSIATRKPDWLRPKVHLGGEVMALKRTVRDLGLVTVCEEAGCPNLSECWSDGTATMMVLGERCTRACGFCLVDTRKPLAPAADEPARVAEAVVRMGLRHAVLTMVARDDLDDGGMAHVAACVRAIREVSPTTRVETLISDAKGDPGSLDALISEAAVVDGTDGRPDVLNHNIETVARLQRAVRPSAGYARSLGVLSRAKSAGRTTKSGLMVGLGETPTEVEGCLADLASIGVDIVTIGQYLRPTSNHLPVARWAAPDEFAELKRIGEALGIGHVEASPLTRSSYHARQSADSVHTASADSQTSFARVEVAASFS
jgi:lipoyl synthase